MGLTDWIMRRKASGLAHDIEEGKKGEMAEDAVSKFKASPGWRSAAMLLLIVGEGVAKASGHDAGPLFMLLRTFFGAIGVNPTEATALGADPETLITGIVATWVSVHRLWSCYQERKAAALAKALEEEKAAAAAKEALAAKAAIALQPPAEETK